MPYDTYLLDKAVAERKERLEAERQALFQQTLAVLQSLAVEFGIRQAYIFGSIIRPFGFHEESDVDIALETDSPGRLPEAIGQFSRLLMRNVDIIDLTTAPFADRIRREGILWTPKSLSKW